jgi:hypothetical protein
VCHFALFAAAIDKSESRISALENSLEFVNADIESAVHIQPKIEVTLSYVKSGMPTAEPNMVKRWDVTDQNAIVV